MILNRNEHETDAAQEVFATLSISTGFREKQPTIKVAYAERWERRQLSQSDLVEHLRRGHAICVGALRGEYRSGEYVDFVEVLGLDFDTSSVDETLGFGPVAEYAFLVYATPRSTKKSPRSRAIFILDRCLEPDQYRDLIARLHNVFGLTIDQKCGDPVRIFFGSLQPDYRFRPGLVLPVSFLERLPEPTRGEVGGPTPNLTPNVELTSDGLRDIYRRKVGPSGGRQNALFECACYARDCGWTHADVAAALLETHINHPPHNNHAPETETQRRHEALATLRSAFNRPPRTPITPPERNSYLPTCAHEELCNRKMAIVGRLIEALVLAGWEADRQFSEREAVESCVQYPIGHNTVRKALRFRDMVDTESGELASFSPFCPRTTQKPVSTFVDRGASEGKKGQGQRGPSYLYTMPSVKEICEKLGVPENGPHDPFTAGDLKSTAAYKRAMTRELVARRPGQRFSKKLLAVRIGVSKKTLNRYIRKTSIRVVPQYHSTAITRKNAKNFLARSQDDIAINSGIWLEDESGKKYPPLQWWAYHLLNAGRTITRVVQMANQYWPAADSPNASDAQNSEIEASNENIHDKDMDQPIELEIELDTTLRLFEDKPEFIPEPLKDNPEFQAELAALVAKYGQTE